MAERANISKALSELLFRQREENFAHVTYNAEMQPYEFIKQGDIKGVELAQAIYIGNQTGTLSDDPVRNKQYLFVATITILCRVCIEAGMASSEAYGLSDVYIRRADQCVSTEQLNALHEEMLRDYTARMKDVQRKDALSIHTVRCMEYIERHLQSQIRLPDIAEALGISPSYLSTTFTQEIGMGIGDYVRKKKLEAARVLLQHSDFSCTDIAEYFGFSSPAYFSKVFRDFTGYSPAQYRKLFYQYKQIPDAEIVNENINK